MALQFVYLESCHYNYMASSCMPFSTSSAYTDPLSARIHTQKMDGVKSPFPQLEKASWARRWARVHVWPVCLVVGLLATARRRRCPRPRRPPPRRPHHAPSAAAMRSVLAYASPVTRRSVISAGAACGSARPLSSSFAPPMASVSSWRTRWWRRGIQCWRTRGPTTLPRRRPSVHASSQTRTSSASVPPVRGAPRHLHLIRESVLRLLPPSPWNSSPPPSCPPSPWYSRSRRIRGPASCNSACHSTAAGRQGHAAVPAPCFGEWQQHTKVKLTKWSQCVSPRMDVFLLFFRGHGNNTDYHGW